MEENNEAGSGTGGDPSPKTRYDFVLFGATGVTGHYTIDELSQVAVEEHLTWAIAGRNMHKLQKVLSESSARTGANLDETPIIIADVTSPNSLLEMAQQAKVVLNCVGPYRFYGEEVVKACIEGGASHLDVSGEPQFLEKMQLLYNGKAKENEVTVVGSVGFDSIPAEFGLAYTRNQFKGEVTNVESFMVNHSGPDGYVVNTGTFESAVYGLAHYGELKPLRKSLYPEPMAKYAYRLPKRSVLFYSKEVEGYCLPFPGSDKSVIARTNRDLLATGRLEKPIEYCPFYKVGSLTSAIVTIIFGIFFGILANFSIGRKLLLTFPGVFTGGLFKKGGPTRKQIEGATFSMTFIAHGYKDDVKDRTDNKPDKKIITKVTGPEAAYVTTPICMVQCGVVLLKEKDKMYHKGGVLTPGGAFLGTSLIERLEKRNVKFVTVSE